MTTHRQCNIASIRRALRAPRRGPSLFAILWVALTFSPAHAGTPILNGAGATFPAPLYEAWFDAYRKTGATRIVYEQTGSGKGIQKLLDRRVDFGATDAFLSDAEAFTPDYRILHFPTCIGAVVVIYHLPANPRLDLTPQLLADIFMGRIDRWDAPSLAEVNPGVALPDHAPVIVHRADSSGTTFHFTDFLTKTSRDWRRLVGRGKRVPWPVGYGVDGNANVARLVKKIPGSIGYISMTYALAHRLPMAAIRNRSGRFILPTIDSVSNAAKVALPDDTRIMITDTPAPDGYPISAFTYLIVHAEQAYGDRTRPRALNLVRFLHWALTEGQAFAPRRHYAPLPHRAVAPALHQLRQVTWNGTALWTDP